MEGSQPCILTIHDSAFSLTNKPITPARCPYDDGDETAIWKLIGVTKQ